MKSLGRKLQLLLDAPVVLEDNWQARHVAGTDLASVEYLGCAARARFRAELARRFDHLGRNVLAVPAGTVPKSDVKLTGRRTGHALGNPHPPSRMAG